MSATPLCSSLNVEHANPPSVDALFAVVDRTELRPLHRAVVCSLIKSGADLCEGRGLGELARELDCGKDRLRVALAALAQHNIVLRGPRRGPYEQRRVFLNLRLAEWHSAQVAA